jgi:predicted methyltransferase
VTVLAPRNDEYVGATVLRGTPFGPDTLGSMLEFVRPGTTVVDAGCNFGSYSVFFAAKVGPTGRVHCFEPQKKMAQVGAGCSARARSKRARCSRFLH